MSTPTITATINGRKVAVFRRAEGRGVICVRDAKTLREIRKGVTYVAAVQLYQRSEG